MVEERPLATDRFRESQNPDEFSEQPGTDLESRLRDNPRKASALDHSIRIGIAALSDIAKALSGIAGQVLPFLGLLCPEILAEDLKRRYQETGRPIQFADAIQLALTLMALRVPYSGPEPRPDGIIGAIRDYEMIASYALRHNHIPELITASSSNPVAFSALQEALRWLREDGKDIPDDLREWSYDVAQGNSTMSKGWTRAKSIREPGSRCCNSQCHRNPSRLWPQAHS